MFCISVMLVVKLSRISTPASPRPHAMTETKLRISVHAKLVRKTAGSSQTGGNDSA